jgi:hypothetical protein
MNQASEARQLAATQGNPEVQTVTAYSEGVCIGASREGAERGQVGGFPHRNTVAVLVCDHDAFAIESCVRRGIQAVTRQRRQNESVGQRGTICIFDTNYGYKVKD